MRVPYIAISPPVSRACEAGFHPHEGPLYQSIVGRHAQWGARVPFLPALLSGDFTRGGIDRADLVMRRQLRLLYALAYGRERGGSIELRLIADLAPGPGVARRVDIVFLGKAFAPTAPVAQAQAERLWDCFVSHYPLEDPYAYPLDPVTEPATLQRYTRPEAMDDIDGVQIIEIRKYEAGANDGGGSLRPQDYLLYPFAPNLGTGAMARLYATLVAQAFPCAVSICVRPSRLFPDEWQALSRIISHRQRAAQLNETDAQIKAAEAVTITSYERLIEQRARLLQLRVSIIGAHAAPTSVSETLAAELSDGSSEHTPGLCSYARPRDGQEHRTACDNVLFQEFTPWGDSCAPPVLRRVRGLVTAADAYGAFRLPVAPESGYLPGVAVRSEPFVALSPALTDERGATDGPTICLGEVLHRGLPTGQEFNLRISDLTRHGLIVGSTGSGKSTTLKHLLGQLWGKHRVPFLVLYPLDKHDYRDLLAEPSLCDELLIYTVGDARTAPLRFNPFELAEGQLLKTHMSRLLQVFQAAFALFDPLPMIYREALRRAYAMKGWRDPAREAGEPGRPYPTMSDFARAIDECTASLKYGREVQDTIRQASTIRIADLRENVGDMLDTGQSLPLKALLECPTVMELGRVGSSEDTSLLMGFLLIRFIAEIERAPRPPDRPHITVVEEAHRLMSADPAGAARGGAGEDFGNILAEVRGYGAGLLVAEQIPSLLVKGAIGNTYLKLMHWIEDPSSFELFGDILNLRPEQREYARTLTPGLAITRSPSGQPIQLRVPAPATVGTPLDTSDKAIADYMRRRARDLGYDLDGARAETPPITPTRPPQAGSPQVLATRLLSAPMATCACCQPWLTSGRCPHRSLIAAIRARPEGAMWGAELATLAREADNWQHLTAGVWRLLWYTAGFTPEQAYCYLAHETHEPAGAKTLRAAADRAALLAILAHVVQLYADNQSEGADR